MCRRLAAALISLLLIGATPPSEAQKTPAAQPASAPAQPATQATPPQAAQAPRPNTLLDGTPVKLRIGRTISSATAKVGDEVDFEVLEDVKVNGVVVIPKGSLALATVTVAQHKRRMGRTGKLNVNIDSVRLVDGEKAALRATEGGNGGGHVGAMTGAIVATSIVFFPAAPLFLFMHGKDITIPKGTPVTAYIDGDMTLDMANFRPQTPSALEAPSALSQVSVNANVPDCDITVDGAFVGNTPSELSLKSGKHLIAVTKKGYTTWSRTLMVSGPSIHIDADLEAQAGTSTTSATRVTQ